MSRRTVVLALIACSAALAAALLLPGTSSASDPTLTATVGSQANGDEFVISLKDANGQTVTHLDPGSYTINVNDYADIHNFHLTGPGVDQKTDIDFIGSATWAVTFTDGSYHFQCDAHANTLKGDFTVGNVSPPPPPPPTKTKTLLGTVGPGFTIALKTTSGKKVTKVKAGKYKVKVSDKSSMHSFHLSGPGVNKKTGIPFKGTATWTVTFRRGKTYKYFDDAHPTTLKGSFKAT